jgi:two-component system NtrC family sensor kinase
MRAEKSHLEHLRIRVTALLIVASLIPLVAIGAGAWIVFGRIIAERSEAHFRTVVSDHAATIDLFLSERLLVLTLISRLYAASQFKEPGVLQRVFDHLNASYSQSFQDLGVIDDTGRHLAYIGPYDLLGKNYASTDWFNHVRQNGHYISDVFLGFRKVPHFIIAVRLNEEAGRFFILRASINSQVFDNLVARGRLGQSGDCFIINNKGELQTPAKDGTPVLSKADAPPAAPLGKVTTVAVQGSEGALLLRTMKWIKDGQWLVIAQQEEAELHAPVRAAMIRGLQVFALGVIIIVLAAFLTNRRLFAMLAKALEKQEKLNMQLLRAGKLASVGELATGVAHEINNPLAIIYAEQTNLSDLLGEFDHDDSRIEEMTHSVGQTKKQVERCKTITHKMLQFGNQGPSSGADIKPEFYLAEVIRLLSNQTRVNNIDLCLELEKKLPLIHIDEGELQQVLTNLINNAMQAMQDRRGGIVISAWSEKGCLYLQVEDSGPGIPADKLEVIFEPFFTTKAPGKGTGLGLAVCYGIITKWGGRIWAESGESRGAAFIIQLPAAAIDQKSRV